MFGEYHDVKLEYDAQCALTLINFEPYFYSFGSPFSVAEYIFIDALNRTEVTVDVILQNSVPNNFESLAGLTSLDLCKR